MKKLMIVAAVALAASFVNAASCNWSCESFGTYDNDASENYVFNWALVDLGTSAVAADKITYDGTEVKVNGETVTALASDTADGWGKSDVGDLTAGNYYTLVVWDGANEKYGIGAVLQATADTKPGATGLNPLAFESVADGINVDDDGTYAGIIANQSQAVPEPTSGLLLLLGVAGLALRRRRA